MSNFKKIVVVAMRVIFLISCSCFLLCFISACGNKAEYVKGEFCVSIAPEYKNAFLEKQITAKDFKIDEEYIDAISYTLWNSDSEQGFIYVQLKEPYWNLLDEIMKSVNELDFVIFVEKVPIQYLDPIR